jgi:voltage-gated potassium channel
MIFRRLTPVRAVRAISAVTLLVTLASGVAMRLIDGKEFPTIGRGLWWAAQTVTTVGYGDVVPRTTPGRALALVVMVCAVAFLTVVTAAITAALIEREHHRRLSTGSGLADSQLQEISDRIDRLEESLRDRHRHAITAKRPVSNCNSAKTNTTPSGGHRGDPSTVT